MIANLKSIKLFNVFGIPIKLDPSWFIVFILLTFTLALGYYKPNYPNHNMLIYIFLGITSSIFLFISVLLHELAHSVVAIRFKIPVKEIVLFIFGGVALMEDEAPSPKAEFTVAIAGPIMSFTLGILFGIIAIVYPRDDLLNGFINYLMVINFIIATFNLVPAFPLDGGRILRSIVWAKKDILFATKISSLTGKIFASFLIFLGFIYLFKGNLINFVWNVLLGSFLFQASKESYETTKINVILYRYKVENLTEVIRPLLPDQTVLEYMNEYYPIYKTSIYPLIGDDGKFYYISIEDIRKIPFTDWEFIKVKDIAKPIEVYVEPFDRLTKAYKLMMNYNLDELPVIYKQTLLGIIRRSRIEYIIQKEYIKL